MSTAHLFDSAFCVHLTWALLHFVWQGALIVGGSILAVWLLGRDSPQRRHRIYLTALLLMPLCLPVTLGVVVGWDADRGLPVAGADTLASWPTEMGPEVASPDEVRRSSEAVARPEPRAGSSEVAVTPRGITGDAWARRTALGYVLGVALMLSRVLLVAVAMAPGRQGSRALVERLSRILGQTECSPVRLTSSWPFALGLALSLVAALVLGLAGSLSALAQSASTTADTSLTNGNEADQTAGKSVDEQHAVAALRAMRVVKSGDLNTTPLRTADFWSVPKEAWPHIGRLLSLHELRIVASDVRGEPFEHIGRLKNLRRLTVINSKCSPTDLTQVQGLANLEYLEVVFTVLEESDAWRSKQLGQLTPVEQEQVDRYVASRPTSQAEQYRRMMEVAVLTDRGLQHLSGLKQLRTLKLIGAAAVP